MSDELCIAGRVTWHSSGEDEGPDVGLSLGLGGDEMLWLGEMPTKTLAEHGVDTTGGGWWFVLYGKDSEQIVARVEDAEAARALFDRIALARLSQTLTDQDVEKAARALEPFAKFAVEFKAAVQFDGDHALLCANGAEITWLDCEDARAALKALSSSEGK